MYIWVLLATFMVALYSFNLSHRSDMKDIVLEPQVEPAIARLMVIHEAAEKYIRDNGPNPEKPTRPITYFPGEIPFTDVQGGKELGLKGYLPYGFNDDIAEGITQTMIYCLNKQGTAEGPGCNNTAVSCCEKPDVIPYLVTFRCVPKKWQNTKTGGPSPYFIKVFRKMANTAYELGYTEILSDEDKNSDENVFKTEVGLRNANVSLISIPKFILNNNVSWSEDTFAEVCGNLNTEDGEILSDKGCASCLAYISAQKKL